TKAPGRTMRKSPSRYLSSASPAIGEGRSKRFSTAHLRNSARSAQHNRVGESCLFRACAAELRQIHARFRVTGRRKPKPLARMRLASTLIAAALTMMGVTGSLAAGTPEPVDITDGPPRLRGILFRPEGPGPHPAVVALHGCSGLAGTSGAIQARYRDWGQRL